MYASNNNSMENDAPQRGTYSSTNGRSNASIVSDKEASGDDVDNQRKESKDKDRIFISDPNMLSQEFSSVHPAEGSVHSDDYFPNYRSDLPDVSIFCTEENAAGLLLDTTTCCSFLASRCLKPRSNRFMQLDPSE